MTKINLIPLFFYTREYILIYKGVFNFFYLYVV